MKREEINIRDPYVLTYGNKYYLYGTRSATCWSKADGFDCYVGDSLDEFEGPIEVFHKPENFFADQNYWAPECYYYKEEFYFVTTFGAEGKKKGVYILKAASPTGPFAPYSERLTPQEWTCIDGTLWFEDGSPYLIFSHSFEDIPAGLAGPFCIIKLSDDLKQPASPPATLFEAKDAPWAKPFPFAKQEFGIDGDCYFSDGPNVQRLDDGKLYMIASSWGANGYAIGVAVSDSGKIAGPWRHQKEPLFPENGGHGQFFKSLEGELMLALHHPNDKHKERPTFWRVKLENGALVLGGQVGAANG